MKIIFTNNKKVSNGNQDVTVKKVAHDRDLTATRPSQSMLDHFLAHPFCTLTALLLKMAPCQAALSSASRRRFFIKMMRQQL